MGGCAPTRLLGLAVLASSALFAGACGSSTGTVQSGDGGADADTNCETRGVAYYSGISETTKDTGITVAIASAEPAPPANADNNSWTVELKDMAGAPLEGALLVVAPYMLDHGHGAPNIIATETGGGVYQASPIYLKMAGLWQVTLKVTPAGGTESRVMFPICIPKR